MCSAAHLGPCVVTVRGENHVKQRFLTLSRIKISFEMRKLFLSLSQTMSRDFDENLMDLDVLNQCPCRIIFFFSVKKRKTKQNIFVGF